MTVMTTFLKKKMDRNKRKPNYLLLEKKDISFLHSTSELVIAEIKHLIVTDLLLVKTDLFQNFKLFRM